MRAQNYCLNLWIDVDLDFVCKGTMSCLFERSEFLIATCKKKKTDSLCVCSANLGFSVRSANRIRRKHGIPLSV